MKYLDKVKDEDLLELLVMTSKLVPNINVKELYDVAAPLGRGKITSPCGSKHYALLQRWIDSGRKDFSVYEDKEYLIDAWVSWKIYSRMQIKALNRKMADLKKLVNLDNLGTVVDLGGGMGYSTLALNEVFNPKEVVVTQIEGTDQYKICKHLFKNVPNARVIGEISELDKADIVFASEYFEHWERPVDHLKDVLKLKPKLLICANSFGVADAIGHFETYYDENGTPYKGKAISRPFNNKLRKSGYSNKEIHFFNNMPAVFIREDCLL